MYVDTPVIQTSAMYFAFTVRDFFFLEECIVNPVFSVALHPSTAVALPSYHVGKIPSSLALFPPVFLADKRECLLWPVGQAFLYVQTCQLAAPFQVFKGGQKEKTQAAGTPSHLVTLNSNRVIYLVIIILLRIRGLVAFQTRSLPVLLACCLYKFDHSRAGRQCNDIVLIFSGY